MISRMLHVDTGIALVVIAKKLQSRRVKISKDEYR